MYNVHINSSISKKTAGTCICILSKYYSSCGVVNYMNVAIIQIPNNIFIHDHCNTYLQYMCTIISIKSQHPQFLEKQLSSVSPRNVEHLFLKMAEICNELLLFPTIQRCYFNHLKPTLLLVLVYSYMHHANILCSLW